MERQVAHHPPCCSPRGREHAGSAESVYEIMKQLVEEAALDQVGATPRGASVAGRQGPSEQAGCDCASPLALAPGEIFVRVQACGVSRVERALCRGAVAQVFPHGAPYI